MEQTHVEKPAITKLVKFSAFYVTRRFITVFAKTCHRFLS